MPDDHWLSSSVCKPASKVWKPAANSYNEIFGHTIIMGSDEFKTLRFE